MLSGDCLNREFDLLAASCALSRSLWFVLSHLSFRRKSVRNDKFVVRQSIDIDNNNNNKK